MSWVQTCPTLDGEKQEFLLKGVELQGVVVGGQYRHPVTAPLDHLVRPTEEERVEERPRLLPYVQGYRSEFLVYPKPEWVLLKSLNQLQ